MNLTTPVTNTVTNTIAMHWNLRDWLGALVFTSCSMLASADSLDEGVLQDDFLLELAEALHSFDIDVTSNLNSRDVVSQRIRRPRLGRFPDLPTATLAGSDEIEAWEAAYLEARIGGLAVLPGREATASSEEFLEQWLGSGSESRLFITFYEEDLVAANKLSELLVSFGHTAEFLFDTATFSFAGELYATAAQRLAIDSRAARRYRSEVSEIKFLGERVRRKSNSLFADGGNRGDGALARREPSVFLKETLGDEFNQSTIEAIIVPGGVALGETAELDFMPKELRFENGALLLMDAAGKPQTLPQLELSKAKALFDFVVRSQAIDSDAIVDIDADGRVKISSALRDTEAGYEIMHADTLPFEFVPNLPVTKSVVIDTAVEWRRIEDGEPMQFKSEYEVRFLSADIMRIAQTRAALAYDYDSLTETFKFSDSWGRDAGRLDENLDYSGLGQGMAEVASYAGWVALFRRLHDDGVPFLHGRYDFMKIDKSGRKTPIRY